MVIRLLVYKASGKKHSFPEVFYKRDGPWKAGQERRDALSTNTAWMHRRETFTMEVYYSLSNVSIYFRQKSHCNFIFFIKMQQNTSRLFHYRNNRSAVTIYGNYADPLSQWPCISNCISCSAGRSIPNCNHKIAVVNHIAVAPVASPEIFYLFYI